MNFKKFGWYLVYLGGIFGLVAALFAWIPYDMRWESYNAIVSRDDSKYLEIQRQFATFGMLKIGFGIASAITMFLGAALISSSKEDSSAGLAHANKSDWLCKTCEVTNPAGYTCKLCDKAQPSEEVRELSSER